jgi:hypothetical protein
MSTRETRQASAEIEVTPEMAAAGGDEIWGNPSMIEGDRWNDLAAQVYRRMERVRVTEAGAASPDQLPVERYRSTAQGLRA